MRCRAQACPDPEKQPLQTRLDGAAHLKLRDRRRASVVILYIMYNNALPDHMQGPKIAGVFQELCARGFSHVALLRPDQWENHHLREWCCDAGIPPDAAKLMWLPLPGSRLATTWQDIVLFTDESAAAAFAATAKSPKDGRPVLCRGTEIYAFPSEWKPAALIIR